MTLLSWHQTARNLSGSVIQCITYSSLKGGEIHLFLNYFIFFTYFSFTPPSPLSSCLQSSLSHLLFSKSLLTVSLLLSHSRSLPSPSSFLSSLVSPQSTTEDWKALEGTPLLLSPSLTVFVCFSLFLCTQNSLHSIFCLCWLWVNLTNSPLAVVGKVWSLKSGLVFGAA